METTSKKRSANYQRLPRAAGFQGQNLSPENAPPNRAVKAKNLIHKARPTVKYRQHRDRQYLYLVWLLL